MSRKDAMTQRTCISKYSFDFILSQVSRINITAVYAACIERWVCMGSTRYLFLRVPCVVLAYQFPSTAPIPDLLPTLRNSGINGLMIASTFDIAAIILS